MDPTKQILSHYQSQSTKIQAQLKRILNHGTLAGTGKLVILPVDQGFEHGPSKSFAINPPAYDPEYHAQLAIESGCNAFAAPLGFIEANAKYANKLPMILKINNSDSLYKDSQAPIPALTSSVAQAVKLGCVGIGFTIYPGSAERKKQYEELAQAAHLAKEAGLLVVVWSYPRGAGLSKEGETALDVVAYAAHIACQLGAHIVKVKPPTDHIENEQKIFEHLSIHSLTERAKYIIQSSFNGKRIVIFSGGAKKDTKDILEEITQLKKGGAFGSIVGRNAFQRPKDQALSLLKSIMGIYKS
ncbi:MAG: class I fructose-bisphosphate aldolase [Bdellovibrionales bacterium]|nr:class I fructose-bisphosphate aldolase [Bdellovibrionales bacterium]